MTETKKSITKKFLHLIARAFDVVLPPYEPRIEIEKKLVTNELQKEHALIRHFSELQLIFGLILFGLGLFTWRYYKSGYLLVVLVLGIILLMTAYELEEIYITSHRIMIRRIGMVERIIRIPSDEEHALSHLVSFQVGRAPVNILLIVISGIGYLVIFSEQLADLAQLLVIIAATFILIFGLRINRRAVTLFFAGGHNVIMGIRKGVPKRIISAVQQSIFEDNAVSMELDEQENSNVSDESPAKELDS